MERRIKARSSTVRAVKLKERLTLLISGCRPRPISNGGKSCSSAIEKFSPVVRRVERFERRIWFSLFRRPNWIRFFWVVSIIISEAIIDRKRVRVFGSLRLSLRGIVMERRSTNSKKLVLRIVTRHPTSIPLRIFIDLTGRFESTATLFWEVSSSTARKKARARFFSKLIERNCMKRVSDSTPTFVWKLGWGKRETCCSFSVETKCSFVKEQGKVGLLPVLVAILKAHVVHKEEGFVYIFCVVGYAKLNQKSVYREHVFCDLLEEQRCFLLG